MPVNPLTGVDNNGDTYAFDRPAGFGRNSFRMPPQVALDAALSKSVRMTERVRLELRAEVFNLANRNNYTKVNAVYGEGPTPAAIVPAAGSWASPMLIPLASFSSRSAQHFEPRWWWARAGAEQFLEYPDPAYDS